MNVAICDDDSGFCELLKNKLLTKFHTNCAEIIIIDTYTISKKFIDEAAKKDYQIVFLDIDMPTENGFSVADRISKISPQCFLVFVTSHDFLVFEAIKKHPFGFIRKSKLDSELEPMVDDLLSAYMLKQKFYIIKKHNNFIRIPLCNIKYIESKGNNILFYVGKEVYSKKKRISDIESELPPIQFVRISRSFIVNLAEVYGVITTAGLTLKSGEHLSVSRDRINEVKQAYINYLRGGF